MMLAVSVVLGILPLLGIVWTIIDGTVLTVDGLFMTLILLTLSGLFFLHDFWECRACALHPAQPNAGPPPKKGENLGHANRYPSRSHRPRFGGHDAPCLHALVAGTGALLPPAQPCDRGHRLAAGVLGGAGLGIWQVLPGRRLAAAALSRLFLSRHADHDCAVYQHLHHAVGDGRARATASHRARQSSGGHDAVGRPGADLPAVRSLRWRTNALDGPAADRAHRAAGFLRADRARLRHRLADGFHLRLSCHHQPVPDSAVAALRGAVPVVERIRMAAGTYAYQSVDLRRGGAAHSSLPEPPHRGIAGRLDGHAGAVLAVHVRTGVRGGQSPDHQTGGVRL